MDIKAESKAARDMVKAIYDDGVAEINGRSYTMLKMTHKQRRKVFAFYTSVVPQIQAKDMSFLESPAFESVEEIVNNVVTIENSLLSKLGDAHWEAHPSDYVTFISVILPAISYPFFPADPTG